MSTLQKRLSDYIKYCHITLEEFEKRCDLGRGTSNRLSEKSRSTTFRRIAEKCPDLNVEWLRTGEGEMLTGMAPAEGATVFGGHNNTQQLGAVNTVNACPAELLKAISYLTEVPPTATTRIAALEAENANLKELLAEKNARISDLKLTISLLRPDNQ